MAATLLFIENREKSRFWNCVAQELMRCGHDIHWLVQNPVFKHGLVGKIHLLPFPKQGEFIHDPQCNVRWPSLVTDRGREHFDAGSAHYHHYAAQIDRVFDMCRPDLVIGEPSLFHELLACSIAEGRNIAFVHPAAERYPQGRFVFFDGMTQNAFVESGELMSHVDAEAYAAHVISGKEQLTYMVTKSKIAALYSTAKWAWTRRHILVGRLAGERFNTPSLLQKWRLSRETKRNLREWLRLSSALNADEHAILHPLQMQPEANIDVWGRPFSNQVETIRRLLKAAPKDVYLALKLNPKPRYEMSRALIELAQSEPRLRLLPLQTTMTDAMDQCIGAVTVCGTVGFESAFGKGRCLSLKHPIIAANLPHMTAETPEEAVEKLLSDEKAGWGSPAMGGTIVQAIVNRSFPGIVSDPFSDPSCLDPDNVKAVAAGFEVAIESAMRKVGQPSQCVAAIV